MDPNRTLVEQQVERILHSPAFNAAPKMQTLLRYLVKSTLDGHAERLKGYTIGVDVFDRGADFDPQADSIVRVQTGRLRKLLEQYYATTGSTDPVRLDIQRGGYAVQISTHDSLPASPAPAQATTGSITQPQQHAKVFGLSLKAPYPNLLILAGLIALVMLFLGATQSAAIFGRTENSKPGIAVVPYAAIGTEALAGEVASGLQNSLITNLSRFQELRVIARDAAALPTNEQPRKSDQPGIDVKYLLGGAVQTVGDDVQITSRLTQADDGRVVWTDVSTVSQQDVPELFTLQANIATNVASRLAQPHGVIQQQLQAEIKTAENVRWTDYQCVLAGSAYSAKVSEAAHAKVRTCLERVTRQSPNYAAAWAMLAWIYGEEERNGFNPRPKALAPFKRALQAAERAVEANPLSEDAYQALSTARFDVGDIVGFREAADKAIRLNPHNAETLAAVGEHLAILEASDYSKQLLDSAIELNPNSPPWYANGLAIHAIMHDDAPNALKYANIYAGETGPLPTMILAAAHRLNGDKAEAERLLAEWQRSSPREYERRLKTLLAWRMPPKIVALALGTEGSLAAIQRAKAGTIAQP